MPNSPNRPSKYEVTVVTASGRATEATPGDATIGSVVHRAFAELGITTPLSQFVITKEDGSAVGPHQKVEIVCPNPHACKIFIDPRKAENA